MSRPVEPRSVKEIPSRVLIQLGRRRHRARSGDRVDSGIL